MSRRASPNLFGKVLVSLQFLLIFGASLGSAQLNVDTSSREQTRLFYQAIYPASEGVNSGWNGNVALGNEGTTTTAYKDALVLRINLFRALAGVPGNIVDEPALTAAAQKSALIMSSNKALSHAPPVSWLNYSAIGADAAGNSNLTLQSGTLAIANYMEDRGSNNTAAGHRRWVLYPQSYRAGLGDIPASGVFSAANSLWIIDDSAFGRARSARDGFVAWPPKGYVPYSLIYPRWSFSYPGANFSNATINLNRNGANLAVSKEVVSDGYGENTLVFIPDNLDPNSWTGPVAPGADTKTTVSIGNVLINGTPQSFSYDVISFDPMQSGPDTVAAVLTGPDSTKVGASNTYNVNPLTLATAYQWKVSQVAAYNTVDGAETGGLVTSNVPASYSLRDSTVKAAGTFSYHLAHPLFQPFWFLLKPNFVLGNNASLSFRSLLGYATPQQIARVQVSLDNGYNWQTLWSQAGTNAAGEANFVTRNVSLAAFAGREVKIRFLYDWTTGAAFPQSTEGIGWYVDNISLANTQSLLSSSLGNIISSTAFSFSPSGPGTYALAVRPQLYGKYLLGWSAIRMVSATTDGNPPAVTPTRIITLSGSLTYGSRPLKTKTVRTLIIKNSGNSVLNVRSLTFPAGFTGKWTGNIAPGASKSIRLTFTPTAKKNYKGSVTVKANSTAGVRTRPISGRGI